MIQVEVLTCVNLPSRNGDILWHVSPAARNKTCIHLCGWVYQCMCVCMCLSVCVCARVRACMRADVCTCVYTRIIMC